MYTYMRNLNRHDAYTEMRSIRKQNFVTKMQANFQL